MSVRFRRKEKLQSNTRVCNVVYLLWHSLTTKVIQYFKEIVRAKIWCSPPPFNCSHHHAPSHTPVPSPCDPGSIVAAVSFPPVGGLSALSVVLLQVLPQPAAPLPLCWRHPTGNCCCLVLLQCPGASAATAHRTSIAPPEMLKLNPPISW